MIPLGWELAVPIAAGAVLGHRLDSRYQSTPVWTFLLLLLGAAAGFYNVLTLIRRAGQRDRHKSDSKRGGAC
jgi:F0F1-type ATP synthase assembly protein I